MLNMRQSTTTNLKKHIKDRDERLARIKQLQRQYEEIYGPGAEKVKRFD